MMWASGRSEGSAGVRGDLRPLIRVEPGSGVDHEAGRLQRVLADVDLDLVGELPAAEGAGVHRRVDLLTIGDQGVACQWQVVLPAGELADAADGAVHRSQA
jgi:hypothetical protein